ncbi:putative phosphoglycerate mutase [Prauserella isguenensis]|uniref:Putative phosphoglycerate mutase n=1 Tax=Prauserella isguenensis TaxID=1470180 RepID=A0A839S083_9PSEU|nr:histidine phosphatase family protein [Prauserella isguenensis]MBB3050965.1 putative phosphoglycerate mutase [Prauserella isguenensis]
MGGRVLLVRHGETTWHAENRYAGSSDVALTDRGTAQAAALARHVTLAAEPPVAVHSSPLSRAVATAEPVATALGLAVDVEPEFREAHFGVAEGRTLCELPEDVVARFRADPVTGAFPDAEKPVAVAERAVAAIGRIAEHAEHAGGPALVVAHNTLLRLALCHLLDIPLPAYRRALPRLENVAITEIGIDAGHASLYRLNAPVE